MVDGKVRVRLCDGRHVWGDIMFIKARTHHREELEAHKLGGPNKTQGGPDPREQSYTARRATHQVHPRASSG